MREIQVDLEHLQGALGGVVYGVGGERIGTVATVYVDDESRDPEWNEVRTGLLKRRFVPRPARAGCGRTTRTGCFTTTVSPTRSTTPTRCGP